MAKVDAFSGLYSFQARGKYSEPNGLGFMKFGWSHFGYKNLKAGYYQRHWNGIKYNWIRARHYWNPPHTTDRAVYWKNCFAFGVANWHALAPDRKAYYNGLKYPTAQSGFTRFMTQYLKQRRESSNFPYLLPKYF